MTSWCLLIANGVFEGKSAWSWVGVFPPFIDQNSSDKTISCVGISQIDCTHKNLHTLHNMTALRSYFSMLSEHLGSDEFVLVIDNAAPTKRQQQQQSRRMSLSSSSEHVCKFSVVSPEDDKCPSRPTRTSDCDLYHPSDDVSCKATRPQGPLQSNQETPRTTLPQSSFERPHGGLNVWSLSQSHFQFSSRMMMNTRNRDHYALKTNDDSSSSSSSSDMILTRDARWKF